MNFHFGTRVKAPSVTNLDGESGRGVSDNRRVSTQPDWYLQEWMARFDKKQAALINELGWTRNKANKIWHGRQPYRREIVNEIATWLGIKPFEMLMSPREALALRQLRETAALIVAEPSNEFEGAPAAPSQARRSRAAR
jgi:plasmid maintenance system antidote protein VapI